MSDQDRDNGKGAPSIHDRPLSEDENNRLIAAKIAVEEARATLERIRAKKEKMAVWQTAAMTAFTALSAVAVGVTLYKGSKPPQTGMGTLKLPGGSD